MLWVRKSPPKQSTNSGVKFPAAKCYPMAGLNLLAAIVIYWNTKQLGLAVAARMKEGKDCTDALLSHISPLGWAHILLTGEYRWRKPRS